MPIQFMIRNYPSLNESKQMNISRLALWAVAVGFGAPAWASSGHAAVDAAQAYVAQQQANVVGAYDVGLKDFVVVKVRAQGDGATSMLLVSKDGKLMTNQMFEVSSGQPKPYLRQFEEVLSGPEIAAFVANFKADQTITFKKGDGSRVLTVLADPNCRYCKMLERDILAKMDNLTVHVLMFPFLNQDSFDKANRIWCAESPQQAWHDWMMADVAPAAVTDPSCRYDTRYVEASTAQMGISGVPVVIVHANEQIVRSGISQSELEAVLALPKGQQRLKGVKALKFKPF